MPSRPPQHRPQAALQRDTRTACQRGYDRRWRKARLAYLQAHPLCRQCHLFGRTTEATVVDHVRPHRGNERLFWDEGNWAPLCKPCHDAKTARGL